MTLTCQAYDLELGTSRSHIHDYLSSVVIPVQYENHKIWLKKMPGRSVSHEIWHKLNIPSDFLSEPEISNACVSIILIYFHQFGDVRRLSGLSCWHAYSWVIAHKENGMRAFLKLGNTASIQHGSLWGNCECFCLYTPSTFLCYRLNGITVSVSEFTFNVCVRIYITLIFWILDILVTLWTAGIFYYPLLSQHILRHPTGSMVAYLVARHRDTSVLTLPLNPDIYCCFLSRQLCI